MAHQVQDGHDGRRYPARVEWCLTPFDARGQAGAVVVVGSGVGSARAASIWVRSSSVSWRIEAGGSSASKRSSSRFASCTRPLRKNTMARKACTSGYSGSRSEEHTSELQSLMRNSYAVICLKKKKK